MQLQRLTGLERQKILDELAALKKEIERLRTILGSRRLLMEIVVNELRDIQEKFGDARRTDDRRRPGRDPHRGPDRRRRHGDHGQQHRLHQADVARLVLAAAARRQGPARHGPARRGLRQPHLRGVHARLHHDLLGPRPGLLAEGLRDSRRRAGQPRQGDRQPRVDGAGREDRRAARRPRVPGRRGSAVHRHGHAQGRGQEDRPQGVRQPARRRHHRHGRRGRRRAAGRAADRRQERSPHRHAAGPVDPLPRGGRALDGPHRLRRPRHRAEGRRRSRGDGSRPPRRHRPHRHRQRLRQADRARGIPPPVARRLRHHQHPDQRPQRRRRRHRLRVGRARADADHAAGPDAADGCEGRPRRSAAPRRASA